MTLLFKGAAVRQALQSRAGQWVKGIAVLDKYGSKTGWKGKGKKLTAVLVNVVDAADGVLLADHVWLSGDVFWRAKISPGQQVQFVGFVTDYAKGGRLVDGGVIVPTQTDYAFTRVRDVVRLDEGRSSDAA